MIARCAVGRKILSALSRHILVRPNEREHVACFMLEATPERQQGRAHLGLRSLVMAMSSWRESGNNKLLKNTAE